MVRVKQKNKTSNNEEYNNSSRWTGNVASFFITCFIIFVAVSVSDASFANSIGKITKNLDVALRELRDEMPVYTNYTDKEIYLSSTEFNPKGMAGLYNLTTKFINFIVEPNFLKKGEWYFVKSLTHAYTSWNGLIVNVFL